MIVENSTTEESAGRAKEAYQPPALTKFGTIESWTLGVPGLINISIVL